MNYQALSISVDRLLKSVGLTVKVLRNGVSVGSATGVFVESKALDETQSSSSLLAATSITNKVLLLSGLAKEPLVGDTVVADKGTFIVQVVEKVRPATTTVLYKLEVS